MFSRSSLGKSLISGLLSLFLIGCHSLAYGAPTAPHPWCSNNAADLHVGPKGNTAAVRDLIRRARKTLFIETYELADDALGKEVESLVRGALQRGVKVFVLCDRHGSRSKGGERLGKRLHAAGAHFRVWPTRFLIQKGTFNIDHRKLYLADGERGLTGGYNLTIPFNETTQDLLVDFRGEVASQLHQEFARDWKMSGGGSLSWSPLRTGIPFGSVPARVVVTSPLEDRFEAQAALYRAIDGARKNIEIEQQFLWEATLVEKLLAASRRGVAVRVLVPERSTRLLFRALHETTLRTLVQAGAQAHWYRGRPASAHLHTKYFSVDDRWACIGSVNGNTRALKNNQELDVEISDPQFVKALKVRLFERDWKELSAPYRQNNAFWISPPFHCIWTSLSCIL